MAGPTRWGIVGAGKISHDFVNAMMMTPDSENQVAAVAARSLTKASEFNEMFGNAISRVYGSYEELAQDNNIDVVYIGTIHPQHLDCAMMMLEAGKNVLVEKPMGMNAKQVQQLIDKAKEKNLFLMEGFWSRFFPVYNHLRGELASNSIGEVKSVVINFGAVIDASRLHKKQLGGSAMLDLGCYAVMLATMIFNEKPERICCSGILSSEEQVDIFSSTVLYYKGNRRAQLNVASDCLYENAAFIYGTNGYIKVPNFWCPEQLIAPNKTYDCPVPPAQRPMNFSRSEGFIYEIAGVRDCIVKGETECSLMTHEHSLIVNEVLDEMRRQIGVTYDTD